MKFDAFIRNNLYAFVQKSASTTSVFISSLQLFDTFYKSPIFPNTEGGRSFFV